MARLGPRSICVCLNSLPLPDHRDFPCPPMSPCAKLDKVYAARQGPCVKRNLLVSCRLWGVGEYGHPLTQHVEHRKIDVIGLRQFTANGGSPGEWIGVRSVQGHTVGCMESNLHIRAITRRPIQIDLPKPVAQPRCLKGYGRVRIAIRAGLVGSACTFHEPDLRPLR